MKPALWFFNILTAFLLAGCGATRNTSTPAEEIRTTASTVRTDTFLTELFRGRSPLLDSILTPGNKYRVQVIYTQVNRSSTNKPSFTHYYYGVDPALYHYPASTVKLPITALALQRLKELEQHGLTSRSTMITEAGAAGQTAVYNDPTTADGRPTIENYIKKILLVSDNDAFNRLYEFLGQEYINNTLQRMGYDSVQIIHRLQLPLTQEQNRQTNPVRFFNEAGRLLYEQPGRRSNLLYQPRQTFLGNAFMQGNTRVERPFDFSSRNRLSLSDLHSMLTAILFPDDVTPAQRFNIDDDDRKLLWRYMSMKPAESRFPQYDSSYGPNYSKLLLFGGKGTLPQTMRIFNKEGDAYGFLTDAAYIVDFEKGIEFLVSATIYCNSDETFNDDAYDYETIGFPFLQQVGALLLEHEMKRPRRTRADLSVFHLDYTD